MGRRGPRPVNMQLLLRLERDWHCNLRVLLEGVPVQGGKDGPTPWGAKDLASVVARRDIWKSLINSNSREEVRSACQRWKQFLDLSVSELGPQPKTVLACYDGLLTYPDLLHRYAVEFLNTTRDKRFPKAGYSDESQLTHISRGLAGAMMDLSPATAIDRLRKMKHGPGGPLWSSIEKRCCCWHCSQDVKYFDLFVFQESTPEKKR